MAVDVVAHITGTVWEIRVNVGDEVQEEQVLVVLESMKMEIAIEAPVAGTVVELLIAEGRPVTPGQALLAMKEE